MPDIAINSKLEPNFLGETKEACKQACASNREEPKLNMEKVI